MSMHGFAGTIRSCPHPATTVFTVTGPFVRDPGSAPRTGAQRRGRPPGCGVHPAGTAP